MMEPTTVPWVLVVLLIVLGGGALGLVLSFAG